MTNEMRGIHTVAAIPSIRVNAVPPQMTGEDKRWRSLGQGVVMGQRLLAPKWGLGGFPPGLGVHYGSPLSHPLNITALPTAPLLLGHRSTMVVTLQSHSGIPTVLQVSRGGAYSIVAWTTGGGDTSGTSWAKATEGGQGHTCSVSPSSS